MLFFIFVEDFFKLVVKNMIVVDELLVLIKMNFICWVLNMLEDMILWLIKCVLMVYLFFLDFSVNGIDGLMLMDID